MNRLYAEWIAKQEVFKVEEVAALEHFVEHGREADSGGEEYADDRVAGQSGARADEGDAGPDQGAEHHHDRRHPFPKLAIFRKPNAQEQKVKEHKADTDASEGTVSQ